MLLLSIFSSNFIVLVSPFIQRLAIGRDILMLWSSFRLRVDDLTLAVKGHIQGWIDVLGELLHGIAKQELDNLCELFEASISLHHVNQQNR